MVRGRKWRQLDEMCLLHGWRARSSALNVWRQHSAQSLHLNALRSAAWSMRIYRPQWSALALRISYKFRRNSSQLSQTSIINASYRPRLNFRRIEVGLANKSRQRFLFTDARAHRVLHLVVLYLDAHKSAAASQLYGSQHSRKANAKTVTLTTC
jgi:hypothetical protein